MRATMNKSKVVSGFKRMLSNERGNMAIVVGMATVPMMLIMGAAVDFENASNTHTELQSSVDSAALFAATLTETSNDALTTKSKPYFDSNFNATGASGSGSSATYNVTSVGDSITATASIPVNNAFMKLAGLPTTTVSATSVVKKAGINLEVSLVLDNTGSMGWINAKTGNSAIFDLKAAATKFIDQVVPDTQGNYYTKVAAIPYNVGVNMGSSAAADIARDPVAPGASLTPGYQDYYFMPVAPVKEAKNNSGVWQNNCVHDANHNCYATGTITNCVTERTGAQAFTDASAITYPLGRQYVVGGASASNGCSVTPMRPLSTSKSDLKNTIAAMAAANNTVGQVGISWGWYTLSPNIGLFSGVSVPAGYDKLTASDYTQRVKKIMILMTDGEYNSAYADGVMSGKLNYVNYTDSKVINKVPDNGDPFVQSKAMCSAIKASGVELYVITFQLDKTKPERVDLTTSCATDSKHLIDADNTSLDAAFSKIANQLQEMRIAQ
jgi:Flp pilus assembly protein TadG